MGLLLKLAWRNLWRNRRRSLLTVLAIAFAAFLSIVMRGIQVGTYATNIEHMTRMFSGALQIQRAGYNENPSMQLNFVCDAEMRAKWEDIPLIHAAAPRVYAEGLAAFHQTSAGVMIVGVDIPEELRVTTLLNRVTAGVLPSRGDSTEVLVGEKLARNLGAGVGDEIVLLAQGSDGTLGNMKYRIVGLLRTGSPDLDGSAVIMGIAALQDLVVMEGRVHAIVFAMAGIQDIGRVRDVLASRLPDLAVLSWEELLPDVRQHISMDNISGILFLGILITIVAFGILNTVLMSITERYREFGVALAMGMSHERLVVVVFLEAVFLALVGLLAGNVLAFVANAYIVLHPIALGGDIGEMARDYGFLPAIHSTLAFHVFLNSSMAILGITLVSCLYPVYRLSKLGPIEGMRSV